MHSINKLVIEQATKWLNAGSSMWLATVIQTYGSSPRPVGSLMAFASGEGAVGSLSGGCIEQDLLEQLESGSLQESMQALLSAEDLHRPRAVLKPQLMRYGVTKEEQERFALPCGGQLHLLLEFFSANDSSQQHFCRLLSALEDRRPITRRINLQSGEVSDQSDEKKQTLHIEGDMISHSLSPHYQLLLVGAGEVTRYVATFAESLDFNITLCDPREEFLRSYRIPNIETVQRLPDELVCERFNDPYSAIMALAHDPRVDDMALMEALQTNAFFIGAMGSERTSKNRRSRLLELGVSEKQLQRLRAPLGVAIGSKTPPEIALSALAQLVKERNLLVYFHADESSLESTTKHASADAPLIS